MTISLLQETFSVLINACNFSKIPEHPINHCTDKSFHQPLKCNFFSGWLVEESGCKVWAYE